MQKLQVRQKVEDYDCYISREGVHQVARLGTWLRDEFCLNPIYDWVGEDDHGYYIWIINLGECSDALVSWILLAACFETLVLTPVPVPVAQSAGLA